MSESLFHLPSPLRFIGRSGVEFETAFMNSPLYKAISRESDGIVFEVNRSFELLTGYSRDEAIGRTTTELKLWVDESQRDQLINSLGASGTATGEILYRTKSGAILECEMTVTRITVEDEGYLMATIVDRTDANRIQRELEQSEQRFRSLFEHSLNAIILIDNRGTIELVNKATEEMFGYRPEQMLGQNVKMLMPEPHRGKHDGYLANYKQGGERTVVGVGRRVEALRSNGETFPIHLAISAIEDDENSGFAGTITDLSEQDKANEATRSLNKQLRATIDVMGKIEHDNGLLIELTDFLHSCISPDEISEITRHFLPRIFPDANGSLYLLRISSPTWSPSPRGENATTTGKSSKRAAVGRFEETSCSRSTIHQPTSFAAIPTAALANISYVAHCTGRAKQSGF